MFSTITTNAANVLADNRQLVDYRNYVTSEAHKNRMKRLPVGTLSFSNYF